MHGKNSNGDGKLSIILPHYLILPNPNGMVIRVVKAFLYGPNKVLEIKYSTAPFFIY
jgi:hypothetical protein